VGPGEEHYLIPVGIEAEFLVCLARSLDIVPVNRGVDSWFNKSSDFIDNMLIIIIQFAKPPKNKQNYVNKNNFY